MKLTGEKQLIILMTEELIGDVCRSRTPSTAVQKAA
ncbi:GSCOCG00002533001-RA-CDS, partial [Cotesia congregata]